jgi:hypothetical protein
VVWTKEGAEQVREGDRDHVRSFIVLLLQVLILLYTQKSVIGHLERK